MSTKPGNKILVIIIITLLIINIGTMLFFILKGHEQRGLHSNIKAAIPEFLQNDIGFNSQQMAQFDSLKKVQNEKFKVTMEDMRTSKQGEFKQLGDAAFSDSVMNDMVNHSLEKQKILELQFFQYIKDIRKICTSDQQAKFDTSFYKILSRKK
jgi:protein CpxP